MFKNFLKRSASTEERIFDRLYYAKCYPDVASAGVDGFDHFMQSGWIEGRNPSRDFITLFYRDMHLPGQLVNPLIHYVAVGSSMGLPTKAKNEAEYLALQASLTRRLFSESVYFAQAGEVSDNSLAHYLREGWRSGYAPSSDFDPVKYMSEHRYISALGISPLYHRASQSRLRERTLPSGNHSEPEAATTQAEARYIKSVIAREFDAAYYLARNTDVKEAKVDPLEHYINFGWRERRRPNRLFDPVYYLKQNPESAGVEPLFHYLTIGRLKNMRPNPIGARLYPSMKAPAASDWSEVRAAADIGTARCVVIMPVYKGREETLAAIFATLDAPQQTHFALLVINDMSPDAGLSAELAALAARGLFAYVVNEANLGFVKTANIGLRSAAGKAAVLLNTDARVNGDWLDRMVRHAERDPTIATITPFSNNATIFSYPLVNENNEIEMEHGAAKLDQLAATCNKGRVSTMPTGVGFCLYMSSASREAVGLLDEEAFGSGYGEENDFCLRASKAGFRNVMAEDIFVYHVGQVSFGAPLPAKSAPGQKALIEKHPEYPELQRQHLGADESEIGRVRLDLMRIAASAGQGAVIFVYHALTGGIVTHVRFEEKRLLEAGTAVIHVRVGVGNSYNIEIRPGGDDAPYCPNLRPFAFAQIRPHLEDFLGWLKPAAIHIHSLTGFEWNATRSFLELVEMSAVPYHYTLHDYSVVCHRNDLVLTSYRYCGLPDVEVCRGCVATDRSYPEAIDPSLRRETFARFLEGAATVTAPSHDLADRLHRAGARYAIQVVPHQEDPIAAPPVNAPDDSIVTVAVVGAIGPHKGSRLLLSLARDAQIRKLPIRFHIIGYSDVSLELGAVGVTETGRYDSNEEALERTASLSPHMIFLPSIWPETYNYTLSLAFALGVRPVVFDIGAPAERIRAAGFGEILPYALVDDVKALNDRLVDLGTNTEAPPPAEQNVQAAASSRD